jgi:hypothetical protein
MDARFAILPPKYFLAILALTTLLFHSPATLAAPIGVVLNDPSIPGMRFDRVTLRPQSLHFKNIVVGQSYTRWVVLTNSGRSAVAVVNVRRSNSMFSLNTAKLPLKIGPGQSASIEISFIPARSGPLNTDFTFSTNRASRLVLHADGDGVHGGLVFHPRNLDFGNVPLGSGKPLAIILANSGSASQTVSRAVVSGNEFRMTELRLPMTLAPGESVTFNAIFVPRWIGDAAGRIILDADGSIPAIAMSGEGSEPGHLSLTPAQLNFGTVTAGTSATLSGKLQAGHFAVTIYSAGITSSEFALSGLSFPFTIAPGQTKSYQVIFSPGSSGSTSAVLSFHGSMESRGEETLSGNAVPRTQHKVNLSWNAGSSGVVGYNIYRASASAGPYSQINPAPDSNTSYLDSTVQGEHTYYYVTTAIASNGKQSAFSNQVEVIVP